MILAGSWRFPSQRPRRRGGEAEITTIRRGQFTCIGAFHGREALNERAQELLDELPNFVFTAAGPVHVLRDLGHLAFTHGPPEQSPAITGYDVALVKDGRIAVLYTLVNPGG